MAIVGDKLTASQEDYLEAIWALIWKEGVARVSDIADRLGVSMPSVSGALKTLAKGQLVEYTPHKYVTLSDRGMELAGRISARHGMLRKFLTDLLGVKPELADSNACRIEHVVDEAVSRRLSHFVKFISDGPLAKEWPEQFKGFCARQEAGEDAAPTPAAAEDSSEAKAKDLVTLVQIKPGQKARIVRLGGSAASDRRLATAGMTPGSVVSVVRVAPLGHPIEVKTPRDRLSLRGAEAQDIQVERLA